MYVDDTLPLKSMVTRKNELLKYYTTQFCTAAPQLHVIISLSSAACFVDDVWLQVCEPDTGPVGISASWGKGSSGLAR